MSIVETPVGPVEGRQHDGVVSFDGVRYGDLVGGRFSEVGPARRAQTDAAAFPQRPGGLNGILGPAIGELPQAEDAFVLRIQAPEGAHGAPVVVFIPGGGFMTGAAHTRWFDSPALVAHGGVVLVTVNYRIGALGHVGLEGSADESTRPVRDLLEALRWVYANIARFGGDPSNVTLAGDSAGAWYAYALSILPAAGGLFARTALVSLPWEKPLTLDAYRERRELLLGELGDVAADEADIERLLDAQAALARAYAGKGMALMPAANGTEVAPDLADYSASAPRLHVDGLLLLSTTEEAAAFLRPLPPQAITAEAVRGFVEARFTDPAAALRRLVEKRPDATPKERMVDAMTLHQFRLAALELADAATRSETPVHLAELTAQSPLDGALSPHCFTLPFLFGRRESWRDAPMLDGIEPAVFDHVAQALQDLLLGFARDGMPVAGGATLAAYDPDAPLSLQVGEDAVHVEVPAEIGIRAVR